MRPRAFALILSALLLAGCGTKPPPKHTVSTTTAQAAGKLSLRVYFYKGNALVPVTVKVPQTRAVAAAALTRLLAGPPPGYETAIPPHVRLESVAITHGAATAHFSAGGFSHSAEGQIVYTLTQFPTIGSVDGSTRNDFVDLTPAALIFVASPARDSTVASPVHANGTADVFEGTFAVDVWSGGKKLRTQTINATSGSGTRGTWSATIALPPGPARLVFYAPNAENGAPLHETEVDVTVR
jgi:Sporulation and spore germination/Immunoglobulin-like domain of bacterial spore germination